MSANLSVWKFEIPIEDHFIIEMPQCSEILSFQIQRGKPVLWALVDVNADKEPRVFRLAGTGHPINEPEERLKFIGTIQVSNGELIFHLFEVK